VKRYRLTLIGRPVLQQLVGAAVPGTRRLFFTSSGYTREAIVYANDRSVCCSASRTRAADR
jgi:hypothetical protein